MNDYYNKVKEEFSVFFSSFGNEMKLVTVFEQEREEGEEEETNGTDAHARLSTYSEVY